MLILLAIMFLFGTAGCLAKYDEWHDGRWLLAAVALILIGLGLLFFYSDQRSKDCSIRGGVYLAREGKCVLGITEAP